MAERPPTLSGPYQGYYHREIPAEDPELTHVGPGTPAGEYLRRFWQPVAFSHELADVPLALRILGEDLVVFRDHSGRVGLLEQHCSHRGTSLEFGRLEERGIRCCYHGWLYDVDGQVLETPAEPPASTYKDRVWHGAYPTREYQGMVFAYLGPPDRQPALPIYDVFDLPGYQLVPGRKHVLPCNWLQSKENAMDLAHIVFLHTRISGPQFTESHGLLSTLEWRETPTGLMTIEPRRVGDNIWLRTIDFILPNIHQFGPTWENGKQEKYSNRPQHTIWSVPIDDTHTMNISFMYLSPDEAADPARVERIRESFGQTDDRPYAERQRVPGDYDAQVSQRPIAIHALEHLASSDRGVIMVRKLLRDGVRAVQQGQDPLGLVREEGQVIPTYCRDWIQRLPPAATPEADEQLLRDTADQVVADYLAGRPVTAGAGATL